MVRTHYSGSHLAFAGHLKFQMLTRLQMVTAGVTADIIVGNRYGMGKHLSADATPAQIQALLKVSTSPLHRLALMNAN